MTNKEAIKEIHRWLAGCPFEVTKEAFTLAIKALEEYPTDKEIQDDMKRTYLGGKEE